MDKQLTITEQLVPVDDVDKYIVSEILMIIQNSQILDVVKFWNLTKFNRDKGGEAFFQKMFLCINALIKANAHLRNYIRVEEYYQNEIEADKNNEKTFVDVLFNKVDVLVEIEGLLTQIKTSLDILAQSLRYLYDTNHDYWHKKLDPVSKRELSGLAIINSLNNLGVDIKPHAEAVISLIQKNIYGITAIVELRDKAVHKGRIDSVQGFRYSPSTGKVVPPIIAINKTEAVYVKEFLNEQLSYVCSFVQQFLITSLSNLMDDMKLEKSEKGEWGWYMSKKG